jgi:ATP-binding cassette, subfamily B, multidrug efflux pump
VKHLRSIYKYFWKYRVRLIVGILFILLSNYFNVLTPQITGFVTKYVEISISGKQDPDTPSPAYDPLVNRFIEWVETSDNALNVVALSGISILLLALLRGVFLFLMRQTIIVMSRHIEYEQKNEIYQHYQQLDATFYKRNSTGDLMNRIAEDVSRVRMFTGPALMYFVNMVAVISFSLFFMIKRDELLTLYVLAPLPILAATIYFVNNTINKRSERIQELLSDLTTNAQESYSGIRVIKSFVQEKAMLGFFMKNSEEYRRNAIGLARVEAIYFPSITLLIGISTLLTIMIGGLYSINNYQHGVDISMIVEFVIYINLLTFPVSAIGLTASMIQRAAASQKRINEFLHTEPGIREPVPPVKTQLQGNIRFENVDFVYTDTGIQAVKNFNLQIKKGEKVAIVGRTGSGKTSIIQLLLRMYDPLRGKIELDGIGLQQISLRTLREQISYVPQDVFLFSDTVENNIRFGLKDPASADVEKAARQACIHKEIASFPEGYRTMIGERGVTLSGGQKQRISIARGLIKDPEMIIFDDCLSAVDAKTEKEIIGNLNEYLQGKTAIIVTHRIFSLLNFDKIIVLEDGEIVEQGTHQQLLSVPGGYYAALYARQQEMEKES